MNWHLETFIFFRLCLISICRKELHLITSLLRLKNAKQQNLILIYILEKNSDIVAKLPPNIYCDLVSTLDKRCAEQSLLEIWDFDGDIIKNLTQQEILDAVNTLTERWKPCLKIFKPRNLKIFYLAHGFSPRVITLTTWVASLGIHLVMWLEQRQSGYKCCLRWVINT